MRLRLIILLHLPFLVLHSFCWNRFLRKLLFFASNITSGYGLTLMILQIKIPILLQRYTKDFLQRLWCQINKCNRMLCNNQFCKINSFCNDSLSNILFKTLGCFHVDEWRIFIANVNLFSSIRNYFLLNNLHFC